ncbi:hypothetical protein ACHAW6_012580 [Cyclotella cf. meneghiniana]
MTMGLSIYNTDDSSHSSYMSDSHSQSTITVDSGYILHKETKDLLDLENTAYLQCATINFHNKRWDHHHLSWNAHVAQLDHEDLFFNEYLMTRATHQKLLSIIAPSLHSFSEPILVEDIVAIGLQVLSGGGTKDHATSLE